MQLLHRIYTYWVMHFPLADLRRRRVRQSWKWNRGGLASSQHGQNNKIKSTCDGIGKRKTEKHEFTERSKLAIPGPQEKWVTQALTLALRIIKTDSSISFGSFN